MRFEEKIPERGSIMPDTPSIHRCPKCDSDDVLVGSGKDPNHCNECEHEWPCKPLAVITQCEAKFIGMKETPILITLNQNLRRKTKFERKLDNALSVIYEQK